MPYCTYCGSSFARDEHLERHILTHTGVRPYKCEWCHMSFARKDLLHRHQQMVHEKNKTGDALALPITSKPAGRTPIACSNCAKNKTKCDKKFPCSRCATRNLRCEMRPTQRPSKKVPRPELTHLFPEGVDGGVANMTHANDGDEESPSQSTASGQSSPVHPSMTKTSSQAEVMIRQDCAQMQASPEYGQQNFTSDILSPHQSPEHAFPLESPPATLDSFIKETESCALESSAAFNMDWNSLQKSLYTSYDQLCDSDMLFEATASYSNSHFPDSNVGSILATTSSSSQHPSLQDVSSGSNHVIEPLAFLSITNAGDGMGDDLTHHVAQNQTSADTIMSRDLDAFVAAHDGWSAFRCTPPIPSAECPRTAKVNLEKLEEILRSHDTWTEWQPSRDKADYALGDYLDIAPFEGASRDKLLAITQSFLHKALEIHADEKGVRSSPQVDRSRSNFIILPPASVLDCCVESYGNSFERFYSLSARRRIDPNAMMYSNSDRISSLLLLLMIAQGAFTSPAVDGRWLVSGLTEACRISLFDVIEKNIMMSGDPDVLHAALLFTNQAVWSGDKWQMDIAMGQRGLYLSMLRHSGYLDGSHRPSMSYPNTLEGIWLDWIWHETRSRLVHAWVLIDQELSLFHDTPCLLVVSDLTTPMPDADALWQASSAQDWSTTFERIYSFSTDFSSVGTGMRARNLRDCFRHFLDKSPGSQGLPLTAMHLRLLLHPLQSLISQFRHLLSCFPNSKPTNSAIQSRSAEVDELLDRWSILSKQYLGSNPMCPAMHASLVMFYLVNLNAVTSMPNIERLARGEGVDGSFQSIVWAHRYCIVDTEKALVNGGQVLRLIQAMPRGIRPPWWAAAIYRVALVFWCQSLVYHDLSTPGLGFGSNGNIQIALDQLEPGHQTLLNYIEKREGVPVLTRRDKSTMILDSPASILTHCVEIISDGVQTRFTEGLRSKLIRLAQI